MKSLLLSVAFILVFLPACRREPAHLSPAQMAPILADLHLADAYSGFVPRDTAHNNMMGKNMDSLAVWTAQIFARHGVSAQEFNQSLDWYRDRPVELDSLYAAVIPILGKAGK